MKGEIVTGRGRIGYERLQTVEMQGEDTTGRASTGTAVEYLLHYRTARIELRDVVWQTGARDLRPWRVLSGKQPVESLSRGRLRLGISRLPDGTAWCELRVARVKAGSDAWSTLVEASLADLRQITGSDPTQLFVANTGAVAIGTKAELLGRTDNTRNRICLIFPEKAALPPLVVFACTRLMPLEDAG